MTGIVQDVMDEYHAILNGMAHWRSYWRDVARYVLPQTDDFGLLFQTSPDSAISSVATMPVAAKKSENIYDMTSIWAVERLAAGLISLKTPETAYWHGLEADDDFGTPVTEGEEEALERVRNFQFKVRGNPKSGFWPAHKASLRSMCAFGDGWLFIDEVYGARVPWRYEHMPLPQCHPAVDAAGAPNMMYRPFVLSAYQIAQRWGGDEKKVGKKVVELANDSNKRHTLMTVLHGVRPRADTRRIGAGIGARSGAFESHYVLPEEKHHIGEGGFYEFPFIRYAWSHTGARAQSEGPVAYALAEIKSLNEMARNELIASQAAIRPPIGVHGKNFGRINFNPGAMNAGLVNADGRPLFAPLTTGARPDFAQAVIEARRNAVRETMYLNLWQLLIETPDKTATEVLIRAQEKGELLGPVGISLNYGLAHMTDRELAIMARRGAFDAGAPLELPESLMERDVTPSWTSPLDRLRQMGELVGMQRLAAFAGELATLLQDPRIAQRVDADVMLDKAREILGAPVTALHDKESMQEQKAGDNQAMQLMQLLEAAKGGGDAMKSLGEGAAAMNAAGQMAPPAGGALPVGGGPQPIGPVR